METHPNLLTRVVDRVISVIRKLAVISSAILPASISISISVFFIFFVFPSLLFPFASHPRLSSIEAAERKEEVKDSSCIIVILDNLSLEDVSQVSTPNLYYLAENGAVGLMNTRTARSTIPRDAYITIGAGTRALGPSEAGYAFNVGERYEESLAGEVFRRNTGILPPDGAVVHPYIAKIVKANSRESYSITPGALGGALRRAGFKTAVLGNSDTPGVLGRYASTIAMDENGLIDLGDVSHRMIIKGGEFPGGWKTDASRLLSEYHAIKDKADFIVIDLGDTARVERYSSDIREEVFNHSRSKAIEAADLFLGALLPMLDLKKTLLLVVSPTPSLARLQATGGLSPVFALGDRVGRGVLSSATTRRRGLIANIDIAPTVLEHFGLPIPYPMLGRPIYATKTEGAPGSGDLSGDLLRELLAMERTAMITARLRGPILRSFVAAQAIALAIGLIAIFLGWERRKRLMIASKWLFLGLSTVPLSMLIVPSMLVAPSTIVGEHMLPSIALIWVAIVAGTLALTLVFGAVGRGGLGSFTLSALATVASLALDLLYGARFIKWSPLGYDLIGGARFYGIGNEYMGIMIGATIMGLASLKEVLGDVLGLACEPPACAPHFGRKLLGIIELTIFAGVLFILASPRIGANLGGSLAALSAFAVVFVKSRGRRVGKGDIVLIGLAAVGMILTLSVLDATVGKGTESHLGKMVDTVRAGGLIELFNVVRRKIAMNLRLIRYTVWTRVLIASFAVLVTLCVKPTGLLGRTLRRRKAFANGLIGSLVGCGVAFLANDSGVVAAATGILFPMAVLMYLVMEEAREGFIFQG